MHQTTFAPANAGFLRFILSLRKSDPHGESVPITLEDQSRVVRTLWVRPFHFLIPRKAFRGLTALTAVAALLVLLSVGALARTDNQGLIPLEFTEEFMTPERVRVSGGFVKGLAFTTTANAMKREQLSVAIPAVSHGQLCAYLESIDGRYRAQIVYNLSGVSAGVHNLKLPTQYKQELSRYGVQELAALVFPADSCEYADARQTYLPVRWSTDREPTSLAIFVSGRQIDSRIYDPTSDTYYRCMPIDGEANVAYTKVCLLDIASLIPPVALSLERRRFDTSEPLVGISVWLP